MALDKASQEETVLRPASPLLKKRKRPASGTCGEPGIWPNYISSDREYSHCGIRTICKSSLPCAPRLIPRLSRRYRPFFKRSWLPNRGNWRCCSAQPVLYVQSKLEAERLLMGWGLLHLWEPSERNRPESAACLNDDKPATVLSALK